MNDSEYDASTGALVKEAIDEARELIKLEVALAKAEVESEMTRMRSAAIAFAVAAFASTVATSMALFAVAFASHAEIAVAVTAAVILGMVGALSLATALRKLPTSFLGRTRQRIVADIRELGERAHGA